MKLTTMLLATAAIAAPLSVAQAADPYVAPTYDWSGAYIGLNLGTGFTESVVSDDTPGSGFFDNNGGESSITVDDTALLASLAMGYNMQVNQVVFGVEGEVGVSTLDATTLSLADGNDGDSHNVEHDFFGTLTARVGFAADRFLPYIKGGVAVVDASYIGGDIDAGPVFDPNFSYSESKTRAGYLVGAGIEYAFTDTMSAKLEYNYIDLGSMSVSDNGGRSYDIEDDIHVVKIGLNWNF